MQAGTPGAGTSALRVACHRRCPLWLSLFPQELARTAGSLTHAREQVAELQKERDELKSRWVRWLRMKVDKGTQAGLLGATSRLLMEPARLPCHALDTSHPACCPAAQLCQRRGLATLALPCAY